MLFLIETPFTEKPRPLLQSSIRVADTFNKPEKQVAVCRPFVTVLGHRSNSSLGSGNQFLQWEIRLAEENRVDV